MAVLVHQDRFIYHGRRISYVEYGSGSRVLVLTHGLLMDRRMYDRVAPAVAARGFRVICVDMLGHGDSDQPHDMTAYSMQQFGRDVIALLDHLGVRDAVIGGTSLGANVALEAVAFAPARVSGLVLEMPVLENALPAAAAAFVPLALSLRLSHRLMGALAAVTRRIPRTVFLVDLMLDFVRRDPRASLAVLDGLIFGRVAPPIEDRRAITQPTLVIGHPSDPIHPFSDADRIARELPDAQLVRAHSIYEWRTRPGAPHQRARRVPRPRVFARTGFARARSRVTRPRHVQSDHVQEVQASELGRLRCPRRDGARPRPPSRSLSVPQRGREERGPRRVFSGLVRRLTESV